MSLNQFTIEAFLEDARTRYTEQFKGKDIFDRYVRLMLKGFEDLQEAIRQVQQNRSVDTAVGAQLDVIGEIVGSPRGLVSAGLFKYFGFKGELLAGSFGSLTDASVGSPWYSIGAPLGTSRVPSDDEYRIILKAKIIKNRTLSRPEDVVEAYKFLFGASQVIIDEYDTAKVRLSIGKILTVTEKGLLFDLQGSGSLLPKTAGVLYDYVEYQAERVFATDGFPGGLGVGDLDNPDVGGLLSNILTDSGSASVSPVPTLDLNFIEDTYQVEQ